MWPFFNLERDIDMRETYSHRKIYDSPILEDIFESKNHPEFGFWISEDIAQSAIGPVASTVHRHEFYEIIYIEEADGEHIIDDHVYNEMKNVLFFVSKGQTHVWNDVTSAKGVLIIFNEAFLLESCISRSSMWEVLLFRELAKESAIYLGKDQTDIIQHLFKQMLKEFDEKKKYYASVLRSLIDIMLIELSRTIDIERKVDLEANEQLNSNQVVYHFQMLLDQKINENLTVAEVAQILGVSQGELNRQLKRTTGYSAGTLIREGQIMEIKRLLVSTDLRIAEIAKRMNFQDAAYLCRAFKKATGISPGEYRKYARNQHLEWEDT